MKKLAATLSTFSPGPGLTARYFSLPALERLGYGPVSRLPVCLRIVLESLVRNCDGRRVREEDVLALAGWRPQAARTGEIPFVVARVLLQDFTGVPLIVDLAAMRSAAARAGGDPARIEPLVPVDLVIDHSVQVDVARRPDAVQLNLASEFDRNGPRYQFLKWGKQAFRTLSITPPGVGIVHQVNLEQLAQVVVERDGLCFPDTLVGTDSHTTMINGLGVLGWGVGGIEAEAAMLGQPVSFLTPDVVGVELRGALRPGVTSTDLVLALTERLRREKVVGKLVEFFGAGAALLPVPHRATLANMAPEYGATAGYFAVDEATCSYLRDTGRSGEHVALVRAYCEAQGIFGIPREEQCDYTQVVTLDLSAVEASVAGPRRPQDRIPLGQLGDRFRALLSAPPPEGYGQPGAAPRKLARGAAPAPGSLEPAFEPASGDLLIAAITSCTNTSNPSVMLAAGLLAKKADERGLRAPPHVKTSLAPGSRVVTAYLERTGLQRHLDAIGFQTVGYGCTTCIGNSGPIDPGLEQAVRSRGLVAAAVLSGNRNFEARIHPAILANFLASPPLVVAFALAGRVDLDLETEPLATDREGKPVYLRELWPTDAEIAALLPLAQDAELYRASARGELAPEPAAWTSIPAPAGQLYAWDPAATYVREPPWFEAGPVVIGDLRGGRALAVFGDSITTDHISPAGSIDGGSPAARWLRDHGVRPGDFNSYGSRRGNHEVMVRGTFANVRLHNLLVPGVEGGVTVHQPSGERMSIFDASVRYAATATPLFVFAGQEYGTGSSRDWAAKGTRLLGVRAVFARSFERIHRANLVGMGVLPCELPEGAEPQALRLDGTETFSLTGFGGALAPRMQATLGIARTAGGREEQSVTVLVRLDTPIEVDYLRAGGILPFVLRALAAR